MQKILYIENDEILDSLFYYLDKSSKVSVDFCRNYENGVELYSSNSYDIVIVNYGLGYGTKILKYILNINPMQRVITLSSEFRNDEVTWNSSGENNYNIIRFLKPIETKELIESIKNFDAVLTSHKNIDFSTKQGIISSLKYISKKFYGIKYDESTKEIFSESVNNFIDIMDFLDKHDIEYTFTADKRMKITSL